MQTFLPYASYAKSASVLDNKRLGKQRVETLQILQVLLGERLVTSDKVLTKNGTVKREPRPKKLWTRQPVASKGWSHHPAVLMWKGHELALLGYQEAFCNEWTSRGFQDTCLEKTKFLIQPHWAKLTEGEPSFVGDSAFHESHQSNLLRKDEANYRQFWPTLAADLPYKWPVTI